MIKGIVFDLDGIVIESEPYFIQTEIRIFSSQSIPLTEEIVSEYLGLKLDDYITILEKRFGVLVNRERITAELQAEIEQLYKHEVPLVAHLAEVLMEVKKTYRLALATSRERRLASIAMKRLRVADYFKSGVYREDVVRGKPHPEPYLKAAALMDLDPAVCAAIEDAQLGFQSAKAAGMFVIGRKTSYNASQDFSSADVVIGDMREVPGILKTL